MGMAGRNRNTSKDFNKGDKVKYVSSQLNAYNQSTKQDPGIVQTVSHENNHVFVKWKIHKMTYMYQASMLVNLTTEENIEKNIKLVESL